MASRQPFSATDYYNDPRRRAKSAFVRVAGRALRPLGLDIELSDYYSPIPHADDRPESWWQCPGALPGIDLDLPAQLDFIGRELSAVIAEFTPPRDPSADSAFHLDNGLFSGGDADLLYAIVRRFKPAHIIELGAGFSTLVASMAVEANRREGHETRLISYDPYAVPPAPASVPGLGELRPVAAQDVDPSEWTALTEGDVVFIDSSHTVKVGGDVVHLLCEVLPRLPSGVIVHVHDIYLPWPYPRAWVAHHRWYWAEQYLLQGLLCESAGWEILVAAYALSRAHPAEFERLVPNARGMAPPLSFWMRRR